MRIIALASAAQLYQYGLYRCVLESANMGGLDVHFMFMQQAGGAASMTGNHQRRSFGSSGHLVRSVLALGGADVASAARPCH